jgi:hypothetical protein
VTSNSWGYVVGAATANSGSDIARGLAVSGDSGGGAASMPAGVCEIMDELAWRDPSSLHVFAAGGCAR